MWTVALGIMRTYQKQVSRAGTNNYISQYLRDVITCPCPWYLLLAHNSLNKPHIVVELTYDRHAASDHWQFDRLFNSLFRPTTKETLKVHITGPLWGNPPVAGNAERVSMWWRRHDWDPCRCHAKYCHDASLIIVPGNKYKILINH